VAIVQGDDGRASLRAVRFSSSGFRCDLSPGGLWRVEARSRIWAEDRFEMSGAEPTVGRERAWGLDRDPTR
jgi:hypothetical protein